MKKIVENAIEQALIDLCETNEFDKVTIRKICEECEITKPTFYKYFRDKYQVAERIYLKDIGLYPLGDAYFTEEKVRESLCNIWAKRRFYQKALDSRAQNSLMWFLPQHSINILTEYMTDTMGHTMTREEEYKFRCYIFGWFYSLQDWILGVTDYSTEEIAGFVTRNVPEFITRL